MAKVYKVNDEFEYKNPNDFDPVCNRNAYFKSPREVNESRLCDEVHAINFISELNVIDKKIKDLKEKRKILIKEVKASGLNVKVAMLAWKNIQRTAKLTEFEANEVNKLENAFYNNKPLMTDLSFLTDKEVYYTEEKVEENANYGDDYRKKIGQVNQAYFESRKQRMDEMGMDWLDLQYEELYGLVSMGHIESVPKLIEVERQRGIRDERKKLGLEVLPEHNQPKSPQEWLERKAQERREAERKKVEEFFNDPKNQLTEEEFKELEKEAAKEKARLSQEDKEILSFIKEARNKRKDEYGLRMDEGYEIDKVQLGQSDPDYDWGWAGEDILKEYWEQVGEIDDLYEDHFVYQIDKEEWMNERRHVLLNKIEDFVAHKCRREARRFDEEVYAQVFNNSDEFVVIRNIQETVKAKDKIHLRRLVELMYHKFEGYRLILGA